MLSVLKVTMSFLFYRQLATYQYGVGHWTGNYVVDVFFDMASALVVFERVYAVQGGISHTASPTGSQALGPGAEASGAG